MFEKLNSFGKVKVKTKDGEVAEQELYKMIDKHGDPHIGSTPEEAQEKMTEANEGYQ